jgi:hypothetical protein
VLHWLLGYLTDRFPQTLPPVREASSHEGAQRREQNDLWWAWREGRYVRINS